MLVLLSSVSLGGTAKEQSSPLIVERAALTQGGFLIGRVMPGSNVTFLQRTVKVDANGRFIIGFGRDFPASAKLTITAQGQARVEELSIKKRDYRIERIDGLPPQKVNPRSEAVLQRIARDAKLIREARGIVSEATDYLQPFVVPAQGRISGYYGSQRVLNGEPKRPHFGEDIAGPIGTPVTAPAAGVVRLADPDMFYSGATIIIDHGMGVSSTYLHLHKLHVKVGQKVAQGELIGEIGKSGRATGPHLDWRINWYDQRLDPALFINRKP